MLSKSKSELINQVKVFLSNNRKALITSGIVFLIVLLSIGLLNFFKEKQNQISELISPSAVLLVESEDLTEVLKECRASSSMFSSLPFFEFLYSHLKADPLLDSLVQFTSGEKIYISLNAVGKSDVDLVFYMKKNEESFKPVFERLVKQDESLVLDQRIFNGLMINDIGRRGEKRKFSFLILNGYFVGSYSGFLLEDVIRNLDKNKENEWVRNRKMLKDEDDKTLIFLNHKNFPKYLTLYSASRYTASLKGLANFASYSAFTWQKANAGLVLSGKTMAEKEHFLGLFRKQDPQPFSMGAVIPGNASVILRLGFSDFQSWFEQSRKGEKSISFTKEREKDLAGLSKLVKQEVAWITSEPESADRVFQYAIIKSLDAPEFIRKIRAIADSSTSVSSANPNRKIYALHKKNLLTYLFGPVFSDFKDYYITSHGTFVVIANQLAGLETYLQQIQNGYVLKRSNGIKFFEGSSNVSFYINPARTTHLANRCVQNIEMRNSWNKSAGAYVYSGVSFSSQKDGKNFDFRYIIQKGKGAQTAAIKTLAVNKSLSFSDKLITEAFPVRSISGMEEHFLIQDSLYKVYLFSRFGTILWSVPLNGKICSDLAFGNVDKTGKEEVLLAVKNKVYAINSATGQIIKGFPVTIPFNVNINALSLIDYDGSKNYRIFASDDSGNIYALDLKGKLLDGWKPRKIDYHLMTKPTHVRIADKDFIIALSRKGVLYAFNRRGQVQKGFPIKLEHSTYSPFFIEKGATLSGSFISILSDKGELVKVDFEGKILKKSQLFRLSPESKFRLLPDHRNKTYSIVRKDKDRMDFLDMALSPLFTQTNFPLESFDVKYLHSVAPDISYWLVNDLTNHRSIIFSKNGQFVGDGWIKSIEKPSVTYMEKLNEGNCIKVNKKTVEIVRMK